MICETDGNQSLNHIFYYITKVTDFNKKERDYMELIKKCINRRCNMSFADSFKFCPYCGKPQTAKKKPKTRRSNGAGCIFERKDVKTNPFFAFKTVNKQQIYIGAFPDKAAAERALIEYAPIISEMPKEVLTLERVYNSWLNSKSYNKLKKSTKQGYNAAWLKLRTIKDFPFADLKTTDYQKIIDYYELPHPEEGVGGVVKKVDELGNVKMNGLGYEKINEGLSFSALNKIKCLISHICKHAMRDDLIERNYGALLELPAPDEISATRFTDIQLQKIKENIGVIPYCDYIYALCYLNFRISEFLELTPAAYHTIKNDTGQIIPFLRGGKKTDAGRNRVIPIHPNVQKIIKERLTQHGQTLFCKPDGSPINENYFRKYCFYPAMEKLGFADFGFTPHSCRRTFSTRMSAAGAREEDIAALMGHADYDVDKKHYINQEVKTLYAAVLKMA